MRTLPDKQCDAEPRSIGVLIVDDSRPLREVLRRCVEAVTGLACLGEANDGCDALREVATLRPGLVLLDLEMPRLNGLQTMALIREFYPASRVFIVSSDDSREVRTTCLVQGADGFISKRWICRDLDQAVARVFPDRLIGDGAGRGWNGSEIQDPVCSTPRISPPLLNADAPPIPYETPHIAATKSP